MEKYVPIVNCDGNVSIVRSTLRLGLVYENGTTINGLQDLWMYE